MQNNKTTFTEKNIKNYIIFSYLKNILFLFVICSLFIDILEKYYFISKTLTFFNNIFFKFIDF